MSTNYPKKCWYVAATCDEITDSPLGRRLLGKDVVLWRGASGGVTAFENRCAHRAFPLSHSRIDGDRLVCGYHGCTYGNDQCDEELVAPAAWPADLRGRDGRDGRDGVKRWTSPHHKTRIAILI